MPLFTKLILFLTLLLACFAPASAQAPATPLNESKYPDQIRLACIGDSITMGAGADGGKSYPDQLQAMLGNKWKVSNFGVSGRTMLRKGDFPYWNEGAFKDAQALKPDVVTIMLGTNDSKPQNWIHQSEFLSDYRDMVKLFQGLPSAPRVYVVMPPFVPEPGNYGINEASIDAMIPLIQQLSKELNAPIIDLHAPLSSHPELLPDRVHPNTAGAHLLAVAMYQSLTGKSYVEPIPAPSKSQFPTVESAPGIDSALITFGGLYTAAGGFTTQDLIPATYQPLLAPLADTNPLDGGKMGVTIAWGASSASNKSVNPGVQDHTGDGHDDGATHGGGVMFSTQTFSMTFSKPVEIPSFFWSYYYPGVTGGKVGSIAVYKNAADTDPAKTTSLDYTEAAGYVWKETRDFTGIPVSKIVFTPGTDANGNGQPLNIDDVEIRLKTP